MPLKHFRGCSCVVGTIHVCYIYWWCSNTFNIVMWCVLQMILGHYGCFLRWATSVVGVVQVLSRNFKMLLVLVGVSCVVNVVCGVVNVCKCYEVLFECCVRCFSQVPSVLTPFLLLLVVLPMFLMVFFLIHGHVFLFIIFE